MIRPPAVAKSMGLDCERHIGTVAAMEINRQMQVAALMTMKL